MGNLLRLLNKTPNECDYNNVFLDFENAKPTDEEINVYNQISATMKRLPEIIELIDNYKGASELIPKAISNPNDQALQDETWNVLLPLVATIKIFYEFSHELSDTLPKLLAALYCDSDPIQKFEKNQALAKCFSEIIDFSLKFDEKKMENPSIQNDLSYYRRVIARNKNLTEDTDLCVTRDLANKISIFLADANPFMSLLSQSVSKYFGDIQPPQLEKSINCFTTLANLCRMMIENPDLSSRFQNAGTRKFCLRVMVGLIIVIDHVNPAGVFNKIQSFDVKQHIRLVLAEDPEQTVCLINALKYSTKHLNDPLTPKSIKQMLV